jgi:hypothetical protein
MIQLMLKSINRVATLSLFIAAFMAIVAGQASASNSWNGAQPGTFSGGDIFTASGNTVTITAGSTPTYLNFGSGNQQLLGVGGVWIVASSGGNKAAISSSAGNSSVTGTSTTKSWSNESSPAGYGAANGYSNTGDWISLVNNSTLSNYGKTTDGYTNGTFTFGGLSSATGYDIGVDYLVESGNITETGRAYFSVPAVVASTPEPSGTLVTAIGILCLFIITLSSKRGNSGKFVLPKLQNTK